MSRNPVAVAMPVHQRFRIALLIADPSTSTTTLPPRLRVSPNTGVRGYGL